MEDITLKLPGEDDFFTQEAFKVLRTNLQFCGQDIQVIAITSCNENEGKTTVSLQLARSLSELGKRVLVIDADMRKSVMAGRNTNAKRAIGLSEVLTGMVKLGDAIYSTQYPNFQIIFAGKYPPNPVELLSGKYFKTLLSETRKVYQYVIVDTPPLGRVIDAAVVAPNCDGSILVIGNKKEVKMMENMSRFHIRPARPDEAGLFYTPHPEEDKRRGTIGHIRMDFGRSGNEFWHTWWPRGPEELNSPAFKAELQEVVDTMREDVLKSRFAMERFCYDHGGKITGGYVQNYGYIVETEHYRYCLRCNPSPGDYNGYLTAYDLDVQRQNMAQEKSLVGRVTYTKTC